jgi:hypothetical protein
VGAPSAGGMAVKERGDSNQPATNGRAGGKLPRGKGRPGCLGGGLRSQPGRRLRRRHKSRRRTCGLLSSRHGPAAPRSGRAWRGGAAGLAPGSRRRRARVSPRSCGLARLRRRCRQKTGAGHFLELPRKQVPGTSWNDRKQVPGTCWNQPSTLPAEDLTAWFVALIPSAGRFEASVWTHLGPCGNRCQALPGTSRAHCRLKASQPGF